MPDSPACGPVYRVVDRENQGWHPTGSAGSEVYAADYGFQRDLADRPYAELAQTRGPLRPVLPVTDADEAELRDLFGQAGRKTVATLASALDAVWRRLADPHAGRPFALARRALLAGREGSWESEVLIDIALFGSGLTPKRVNEGIRDLMAAVLWRWVTDPDRYTEVAETLAGIVSRYCDGQGEGWKAVADQWLQPGGLAQDDFSACYRLFYSHSEHFDTGVI